MKTTYIAGAVAGLLTMGTTAKAEIMSNASNWFGEHFMSTDGSGSLFNEEEVSLDLGFNWFSRDRGDDGRWGFGFGGKYFFTRELGVNVDSAIGFNGGSFLDFIHASFVYRYPIEEFRIAPYALAGAGCEFDPSNQLSGQFGGGVEYRVNYLTGVYFDATYNIVHSEHNYTLLRGGIRIVL